MTTLTLHPAGPIYVSSESQCLGGGWRKLLAFVPQMPTGAATVNLNNVLGTGCIVVAAVDGPEEWVTAWWIERLTRGADAHVAFLERPRGNAANLHGEFRCQPAGTDWIVKQTAAVRCAFSGHRLIVPRGTKLTYDRSAPDPVVRFAAPAGAAAILQEFELHGHQSPELQNLALHLAWPQGLLYSADLDVRVIEYEGTPGATVLGQNFSRLRAPPFGDTFAEFISYPLVSVEQNTTVMALGLALDPAEPRIVDPVPFPTVNSHLRLREVRTANRKLDPIPLNFFAATGARLSARQADFAGLKFHFVPRLAGLGSGGFEYSGALLLPNGTLKVASGSALLGASLLERVDAFTGISFNAFAPAAGLDAAVRDAEGKPQGPVEAGIKPGHFLSDRSVVAAIAFVDTGRVPSVRYSPDAMPLYHLKGKVQPHPYAPLRSVMRGSLPVGMVDLPNAAEGSEAFAFEQSVIAPHRLGLLGGSRQQELDQALESPGGRALALQQSHSVTPQGFRLATTGTGAWKSIEFAAGKNWKLVLDLGLHEQTRKDIEAIFTRKDIFIVITRMPSSPPPGTGPALRLEYSAGGWTFGVEPSVLEADADEAPPPITIIKFGGRTIENLIGDTNSWNGSNIFIGSPADVQKTRVRLDAYLKDLRTDLTNDQTSPKPFAAPFVAPGSGGSGRGKLVDPAWNGLCVFSLGMPESGAALPPDLRPLLDDYVKFLSAAVLCADIRPAEGDGVSDVVALVRHERPTTEKPETSADSDCAGGFSLDVLRVLLKGDGVDNFECKLRFLLSKFLGQSTKLADDLRLIGTYDKRTDTVPPSGNYSFSLVGSYEETFAAPSPVERVKITKIGYERIGGQDGQLLLQGEIDIGFDDLGAKGISFDRMGLRFNSKDRGFSFNPGLISLDFNSNGFSKLLKSFPLKLKSFIFGRIGANFARLTDLGFEPLGGGIDFAYGLTFDLDLGSLGAIARKLEAFGAQLFVGWKISAGARIPSLGLRLSGNRGGPLEINAFDVVTLKADSYGYGKVPGTPAGDEVYYLNAQNLRVKLLDMEFPKGGAKQHHLYFFYPASNPSGVGFVYGLKDKGAKVSLLGIGKHATVKGLTTVNTVEMGMELIDQALENVNEDNLPLAPGTGVIYDAKVDWFLALAANVFGLADVQLLMADPKIYGARITIDKSKWGLGTGKWFIDMLYRRLDDRTGIFSVEVPPPIAMLDFGAVQVILPTIRAEFGSPGNHMLVDLGFPEKKSLATWARTGKIVAGIFGGEGGAYFGRIAPGAFDVAFTDHYKRHYEFKDGSIFTAGIAGSFGLMRYFGSGPLTGHASLVGFFTAEGSIATIQLKENGTAQVPAPPRTFISLVGAFGIKGSVEACVDFGLIKVAVGFNITLMFSLPYRTWHAIVMEASVTVNAYARVVIARIRIPFDGKLEIAINFSFSFQTAIQVQLAGADSRLATVFAPPKTQSVDVLADLRADARNLVPPAWDWPDASPASLGLPTVLPFPAWLMAARSLDEDKPPSGPNYAATLVSFMAIGQNPQNSDDSDSIASLTDVLARWMLLQVSGKPVFDPAARIGMPDLLAAHAAFQPGGEDGSPVVTTISLPGTGNAGTYSQSISGERGLRTPRKAVDSLTLGKLQALYRQCLAAQALVPASDTTKPVTDKDKVAAVMYPLPPAFELFASSNAPTPTNDWDFPFAKGTDLSTHQPLDDGEIDKLKTALEKYYAMLLVEDDAARSAASGSPQSMQGWLFLFWHQLLCAELARGLVAACEAAIDKNPLIRSFTAGELLAMVKAEGTASIGWKAAGTAARLFNSGLRFDLATLAGRANAREGGMAALAGTAVAEPQRTPGHNVFIGLRSLKSPADWFTIAPGRYTKEAMHEGVMKRAIALEVSQLYTRSGFPGNLLAAVDAADPGYTLRARQYAVTRSLSLGSNTQLGIFPPMLLARQRGIGGHTINWTADAAHKPGGVVEPRLPWRPMTCVIVLPLRGKVLSTGSGRIFISLEPLAAAERETLRYMRNHRIVGTRLGLRTANDAKARPQDFADVSSDLPALEIFRDNVTREENPPKLMLLEEESSGDPYQGQGSDGLLKVVRAWTLTSSSSCYVTAHFQGVTLREGDEVELLAVFDPDKQAHDFAVGAANAVQYGEAEPYELMIGTRTYDTELVPDSNAGAIVVRARRRPANQAMIETSPLMRDALQSQERMTLGELRELAGAGSEPQASRAALAQDDAALLADLGAPWANQFDLLAYSVFVDGVKQIDENGVIPFMPDVKDLNLKPEDRPYHYMGHIPASQLTKGGNPYALVGKRIRVEGRLRDQFGQRAPSATVTLLDRVETYRDQIIAPDEWDHLRIGLTHVKGIPHLSVTADLDACRADGARAALLARRFAQLKAQLEDPNVRVEATWAFGTTAVFGVPVAKLVKLVTDLAEASAPANAGQASTAFTVPLAWPALQADWSALPFGAILKVVRQPGAHVLQEATLRVSPLEEGSGNVPMDFFARMLKHYGNALLGAGDPGQGFGRYWLVRQAAVNLKLKTASAQFCAMPPYANRLVSTSTLVDRDVDIAVRESFDHLDALLQQDMLPGLGTDVTPLLKLKKTASVTCAFRTSGIKAGQGAAPESARRALEDAVAAKAGDAYRIASVLDFQVEPPATGAASLVMKIVGDLAPPPQSVSAAPGVTTIGIVRTGDELHLPLVVWDRQDNPGTSSVPETAFLPVQVQIDVKDVPIYYSLADEEFVQGRIPYRPPQGHWLKLLDIGGFAPAAIQISAFTAPSPRREAVRTPETVAHFSRPTHPGAATLALAKKWNYEATFKLPPGARFDSRVDALRCEIEYPFQASSRFMPAPSVSLASRLLSAAVAFNAAAAPDGGRSNLGALATELASALAAFGGPGSLGGQRRVDGITLKPNTKGDNWVQSDDPGNVNKLKGEVTGEDRAVFTVTANGIDLALCPFASASLQVARNEELTFGYGNQKAQPLDEQFVYRTPRVGFSDAVVAGLSSGSALPAGAAGTAVGNSAQWVYSVYEELLKELIDSNYDGQSNLSMQCRVGWNVGDVSRLSTDKAEPAAVAMLAVTPSDINHVIPLVAGEVTRWMKELQITSLPAEGHWSLDVAVFVTDRTDKGEALVRRVANFSRLMPPDAKGMPKRAPQPRSKKKSL